MLITASLVFLLVFEVSAADKRFMIQFDRMDYRAENSVREVGGNIVHRFPEYNVVSVSLSEAALNRLKSDPHVKKIEPDPERYLMSETIPYGIPMMQANLVSDELSGDRKVCIIDSGFQKQHEDLQDARLTGISLGGTGTAFEDRCGHGTHVAGIIAALENQVGVIGVMPGNHLRFHIVKLFGDDCKSSSGHASDLIAAVRSCRSAGSNVINMSLGGPTDSSIEEEAFGDAFDAGILLVAAAGNEGDTSYAYPASYNSVISVGAINSKGSVASFSQRNDHVEFAAPGVDVLSTAPFIETDTVSVDGKIYQGNWIEYAARSKGISGTLVNGALCDKKSASWNGKIVLCKRGQIFFRTKVENVQASGGVGTVIYNNAPGNFSGTLGEGPPSSIPAISLSQVQGLFLLNHKLKLQAKVVSQRKEPASGYDRQNGTSFSSPHVAAVAALIWSYGPQWTNEDIRAALRATAKDLGPPGKDNSFGYGLPQAKPALDWLRAQNP
ncbi:S8 family serine peptidase [bacterium]|nr:S8 family serine peptidase [bacterium]